MDDIYRQIGDDMEVEESEPLFSEIEQFYSEKVIFLTGCTGFIGKCLVEKILRGCPNVKKLLLLVRVKKNESIDERLDKYFNNIIFDPLRKMMPDFTKKITVIEGNLSEPGMGISSEDRQLIIETVDLIIHNAAMVIFSAKVSTLLSTNVLGTKEMLDLAKECHHLKSFMYVSTAYSHCYLRKIEEKFYDPPGTVQMVRDMIKADCENEAGLSKTALKEILGPYPNAYIYTKAVAEGIVQDYAKKVSFPCGIFRMSIVISTYKEPLRGWCGNMNGPTFIFASIGLGILHTSYVSEGSPALIPADLTCNALLTSVWDLTEYQKDCREGCIYNYGMCKDNSITYNRLYDYALKNSDNAYTMKATWVHFMVICYSPFEFMVYHILLHWMPAFILDIIRLLQWKKMKFVPLLMKIEKHRAELFYFMVNNWELEMNSMEKLWNRMKPGDREKFYYDLRSFDWNEYCVSYWKGLRVYLLKDPMSTLEAATRKRQKLLVAHYILTTGLICFFGYIIYKLFSLVFL